MSSQRSLGCYYRLKRGYLKPPKSRAGKTKTRRSYKKKGKGERWEEGRRGKRNTQNLKSQVFVVGYSNQLEHPPSQSRLLKPATGPHPWAVRLRKRNCSSQFSTQCLNFKHTLKNYAWHSIFNVLMNKLWVVVVPYRRGTVIFSAFFSAFSLKYYHDFYWSQWFQFYLLPSIHLPLYLFLQMLRQEL